MKKLVKKSIGVLLIVVILCSTLTGCFGESDEERTYVYGDTVRRLWGPDINAKVETNVSNFSKNKVTFDLFVSVYDINNPRNYVDDFPEIFRLAIYVSKDEYIARAFPYKLSEAVCMKSLEDVENAELIREISYDEAFNTDFGYTIDEDDWVESIKYNHKERITIPEYFFDSNYESTSKHQTIYIHVIEFLCYDHTYDGKEVEDGMIVIRAEYTTIEIKYKISGDKVMLR